MLSEESEKSGVRLVKYLASCGAASRRGAGDLVQAGRVAVNGEIVLNMACQVLPGDAVSLDGKPLRPPEAESAREVILLNKPSGTVCSLRDPHNPRTVLDCLPPGSRAGLKPVGRLDKETTGLLLLTSDGDLMNRLTHPRFGVRKTYRAVVSGRLDEEALALLRGGMMLGDGPTAPARAEVAREESLEGGARTTVDLTIHEGRNRQVRRMFEALGHRVLSLERTAYGPLALGGLGRGQWRKLTLLELEALRRETGKGGGE